MSIWRKELAKRIRWILIIRIILFISILVAVIMLQLTRGFVFHLLLFYSVFVLAYLLTLFFWKYIEKEVSFRFLCSTLLAFEIALELAIIHYTGGIISPFYILLAITVVSSALIYQLVGTLVVATFSTLAYSGMILGEYKHILNFTTPSPIVESVYSDSDTVFFGAYVFVCFLYLASFISGYLSGQLRMRINELELKTDELERLKVDLKTIFDRMTSGLITVDLRGRIIHFNPSATHLLGLPGLSYGGKQIKDILPPRFHHIIRRVEDLLIGITRKEIKEEVEFVIDGEKRNFFFIFSALEFGGEKYGAIILFEDITEEKRTEEYLRSVEKLAALGELSTGLAHEIRNPLVSIRGSAEMLKQEVNLEGTSGELLGLIVEESDRLSRILENFLQFARAGRSPNSTSGSFIINSVLESVIEQIKQHPAFPSKAKIKLELNPSDELWVKGNKDMAKQIFWNLILNAVEAIDPENGIITITRDKDGFNFKGEKPLVGISVTDNGYGIEEEKLKEIFKPFYSTKKGGTGMGLSIAQRLACEMGGYITVESKRGVGSKFTVYLVRA